MRGRGFTLLEILVTLVIVAMFSTAIYAMFLRSLVDTRWIGESVETGRLGQSLLRLFERDVTACVPAEETLQHFVGSVSSDGSSLLEFISAVDSRSGDEGNPSDLVRITYMTVANEEAGELVKLYRKEERSAGRSTVVNEEEFVLLDDKVKQFDLEYFDGAAWQTVWSEPALPRAIRIRVVLERQMQTSASRRAEAQEFTYHSVIPVPASG